MNSLDPPKSIRIGCGAGFSGDRIEPAVVLAERGKLNYLVLECLAERTIALAQKQKIADPAKGYDPLLERRVESLLPHLVQNNVRLITNMGAANPIEGAKKIVEIAHQQGFSLKVAAVTSHPPINELRKEDFEIFGNEQFALDLVSTVSSSTTDVVSVDAYLGVEGILEALETDAQVVITGRVADPSLFLAPMMHEFGWPADDFNLLGKGTIIGHLLECAGHITGGYFADPLKKPVEGMENLGHPFADIFADGSAIISKVEGTGGVVNPQTVKEQLLYEVVNPSAYFTPDVVADFTTVRLREIAQNQVEVTGGGGSPKPTTYKASVGYRAFWLGEGEISYAGPAAHERAMWAGQILEKRLRLSLPDEEILIEVKDYALSTLTEPPRSPETGASLRIAVKAHTAAQAALVGQEVEALYTNGPAGGGGVRKHVNEVIGIVSVLVDRTKIQPKISVFETTRLETERLLLRPTGKNDALFMVEIYNTPKWLRFIGDRNVHSEAAALAFLEQRIWPAFQRLGFGNYTIIEKSTNQKIGFCGLYDREGLEGIDVGFALLPDFEGKGYGHECASALLTMAKEQFQLPMLGAITNLDNVASQNLLIKLGFSFKENKILGPNNEVMYFIKTL